MLVSLAGRSALVTGAGSGIGRGVALAMARAGAGVLALDKDEAAARAVMVEINTKLEAAGLGGGAWAVGADVRSQEEVRAAVEAAQRKLQGDFSICVNCAGVTADAFLGRMTEAQWDDVVDVNLKGTFMVTQAAAAAMGSGGSIVNVASIIGKAGNLGQANYAASKAGVVGLSKSAAKELARAGVRVNCVLPGFVQTPMVDKVPPRVLDKMLEQVPLGRLGSVEEIADMCVFLSSDRASFVTGAAIEVTGGYQM